MSARPVQSPDIAAIRYIKQQAEIQDRGRSWLAEEAGIPYQTLRKYFDNEESALSVGDLRNLLRALQLPSDAAMKEIDRMALAIDEANNEPDTLNPEGLSHVVQL